MMWNGGAGWVGWLLMGVGMVAFWFLVIIAIMALLPGVHDDHRGPEPRGALRVLDEQLARGELGVQDYRTRREALSRGS